jgi:sulfonate transport system substrate-binding protein
MKKTNKLTGSLALLAGVLATAGVTPAAAEDQTVTHSTAVAPRVPGKERVAKISLTEITSIAAQKGFFQEEYAKVNATAQLVLVSSISGVPGAEASLLDRGDLHITSRMAYPALQHLCNGLDGEFIWQSVNPHPHRVTISVLKESDIHSVGDLVGKKLGSSLVGCPYYGSREAIQAAGHDLDDDFKKGDIRYVNVSGVAGTAAFLAGRIDAQGSHPNTIASLYVQDQIRDIATAVPDGAYVTGGGRTAYFAMRQWAQENPDLVQAFLRAYIRAVRWVHSDNGAHIEEAATIAAREVRETKSVALYDLKNQGTITYDWGQVDYQDAVNSIKQFQNWQIAHKDPFFTRHHLTDQEIEKRVDKRFFAGGEYFVDTRENPEAPLTAQVDPATNAKTGVQLAQAASNK